VSGKVKILPFQILKHQLSALSITVTGGFSRLAKMLHVSYYPLTSLFAEIPGPGNYVAPSEFGHYESKHKNATGDATPGGGKKA